jgi:N-methylhydantoinase B
MVALDLRSMIACNNVARERMLTLVAKYGPPIVDEAFRLLIEQSEQRLRQRLRELPDGRWQSRQYLEVKDEVFRVILNMTKTDDSLVFDFTGSSPQARFSVNCSKWASLGGLFAPLFPLLCYDIVWNEGVIRPITMIAPEASIVNCTRPAPVSVATVGAIQSVNNAACSTIGKMLLASEKYAEEATPVWHANHFAIFMFGQNQHSRLAIGILTETFAGAGGARTFADGVDLGGEIPNPISRMANVETIEATFPIRYMFRRRLRDSGGPGFYRGGAGGELAIMPHDAPDGGIHYVVSGKGTKFPQSEGLAGGFPGAVNDYVWVKTPTSGANADPFAQSLSDMAGEKVPVSWGVFPLMGQDALYVRWNGGGGIGDPLERDPEAVVHDVVERIVSPEAAAQVYGVVLSDAGINREATTHRRAALKRNRLAEESA